MKSKSLLDTIFHQLARFFYGVHLIVGISTPPANASRKDERSFVLMWLGIIVFMIAFFAVMIYLLR